VSDPARDRWRVAGWLARLLGAWAAVTAIAAVAVHAAFAMPGDRPGAVVASVWSHGERVARAIVARAGDRAPELDAALQSHPRSTLVYEAVTGDGPVLTAAEATLALSLVPGRDGLMVSRGGASEYMTPDDLLSREAYDRGISISGLGLNVGADVPLVLAVLSERFGAPAADVWREARFRRIRVLRTIDAAPPPAPPVEPDTMTKEDVFQAALAAGRYLARGVDDEGRFRYMVDAPTNRSLPGYDWPRHAGATYFLAQIGSLAKDAAIQAAAGRAAGFLRTQALSRCGEHACVGADSVVDLGSAALTLLAFVEIARTKIDPAYAAFVPDLAAFLRSQQRADGEFMHRYDRDAGQPIDVQGLYYSGEAALALSRAHLLTGDARDLDSATRALARLVGPGWSFFGSRYYFGEEHWTCQTMDDLWGRSPNRQALDFCLRWQAYQRNLQFGPGDTPFDADGAYGVGPLVTPRLTPVGSRSEAGIATLDAAARADVGAAERARLERQMRRCLAQLLRHQLRPHLRPAQRHLFADPDAIDGAMPGSEVDWQLRIDYAQHTGSALIRWLELEAAR
jgi:hypothetical protein